MAKLITDGFIDGGLAAISGSTTLRVLSGPATTVGDLAGLTLASVVVNGGDFTIANGDVSGRKVTVAQQVDVAISSAGDADHVSVDDGTDFMQTTCPTETLGSGTVTVQAFANEVRDPT